MKITIYGSGCKSCHTLYENVLEVVKKHAIDAEVVYETDLKKIIARGIMQMPGLEVDGKMKCVGRVPKEKELLIYFGK